MTYEITLSVNNDISFNITDTICKHSIVQNQAHEGNSILLQLLTFIKKLALYKLFNPLKTLQKSIRRSSHFIQMLFISISNFILITPLFKIVRVMSYISFTLTLKKAEMEDI